MKFISFEISLVALLPALILCGYIYYKDRIEKEPLWLLALLFLVGAVAYMPTFHLQSVISNGVDALFADVRRVSPTGTITYSSSGYQMLHHALFAFAGLALPEIVVKWCILYFGTRRNSHFNYLFDGIVYSVFISLGFSAAESVRFAWINGWDTLLRKTLSATPCHLFVGVLMGYFYTMWKAHQNAQKKEDELVRRGIVAEEKMRAAVHHLALSSIVPFVVSGICMFAGMIESKPVNILFYFILFMLYGFSFIGVDRIASKDRAAKKFSLKLLQEKHPEIDLSEMDSLTRSGNAMEKEEKTE